jgi:hypothetical protein
MRISIVALLSLVVLLIGCSDDPDEAEDRHSDASTKNQPDNPDPGPKTMIDSTEYDSLDAFLSADGDGFVILHQEPAPASDDRDAADALTPKLAERFEHFLGTLKPRLGAPNKTASEWDLGIPTFASGNGYAHWNAEKSFVSLFVSWDNPEDPAFIILARAPLSAFDATPGAPNPWKSKWMEKGQW